MYFAVKEDKAKGTIIIHYIFLYAYQPGQTVRVLKAVVPEFDALLWDVGYHQADLEHFAVTLKPLQTSPQTFEIQNFIFEADDNQVSFHQIKSILLATLMLVSILSLSQPITETTILAFSLLRSAASSRPIYISQLTRLK
jgi:hypothetical protein